MIPQIILFNNFFIKNGSHNTIYTFKNYFTIVFSVSAKINSIQTDPKEIYLITLLYIVVIGLRLVGGYNL